MIDMREFANKLLRDMAAAQTPPTGRWYCPYCGKDHGEHPDPDPAAIMCCGEVGHLTRRRPLNDGDNDEAF